MNKNDRVYYLYTDQRGVQTRFAAVVLSVEADAILIRIGRYDVHSREISTFESTVSRESLQARSISCSFEDELNRCV